MAKVMWYNVGNKRGDMKKLILLLALVVLVSGCATVAGYEMVLKEWMGKTENHLISRWGIPTETYTTPNGNKLIKYRWQNTYQTGGYYLTEQKTAYHRGEYSGTTTYSVDKWVPVENHTNWCDTTFTASPDGYLIHWSWRGNSCKAKKPKTK